MYLQDSKYAKATYEDLRRLFPEPANLLRSMHETEYSFYEAIQYGQRGIRLMSQEIQRWLANVLSGLEVTEKYVQGSSHVSPYIQLRCSYKGYRYVCEVNLYAVVTWIESGPGYPRAMALQTITDLIRAVDIPQIERQPNPYKINNDK